MWPQLLCGDGVLGCAKEIELTMMKSTILTRLSHRTAPDLQVSVAKASKMHHMGTEVASVVGPPEPTASPHIV